MSQAGDFIDKFMASLPEAEGLEGAMVANGSTTLSFEDGSQVRVLWPELVLQDDQPFTLVTGQRIENWANHGYLTSLNRTDSLCIRCGLPRGMHR